MLVSSRSGNVSTSWPAYVRAELSGLQQSRRFTAFAGDVWGCVHLMVTLQVSVRIYVKTCCRRRGTNWQHRRIPN